jgi:hypothetical protein
MRGKPDFNDLEKDLNFVDGLNIQKEKIILCSEQTCGNKVMCFEYLTHQTQSSNPFPNH